MRLLVLVAAIGCGGSGSDSDTEQPVESFAFLDRAIEDELRQNQATSLSIAIWRDGEVVWVGGYAEDGARAPNEDTQYMIGSDTKKIAAISLLRRVDAGALRPDSTIAEVLPDLVVRKAPRFTGATVGELLSHQGGVVDGVEDTNQTTDAALRDYTYGRFARSAYELAPPGVLWNYANPNHSMAGLLDEVVGGEPWADLVEDQVFAPLGMSRTVARRSSVDVDNVATGVGLESQTDRDIGPVPLEKTWESAYTRPAGLVWSTPSDQMRLASFLVDGSSEVLSPESLAALHTAHVSVYPDIPGVSYGYGLFVGRGLTLHDAWYDIPVWSHGGNTLTHTSTFYVLPEQRFAISILSNGYGDDWSRTASAAMANLVDLPEPSEEPAPPFDPAGLDALVGTYSDPNNLGDVIIRRERDGLVVKMPTLDTARVPYEPSLKPLSTRVWVLEIQGTALDFSFIDGPDGSMYFRNRVAVAVRSRQSSLVATPTPSPERVRAWASAFPLDPVPPLLRRNP